MADILGVSDDDHNHSGSGICTRIHIYCSSPPPSCVHYFCLTDYTQFECSYEEANANQEELADEDWHYEWREDITCEEWCQSIPEELQDDDGECGIWP